MPEKENSEKQRLTVRLPDGLGDFVTYLVDDLKIYSSKSGVIDDALRKLEKDYEDRGLYKRKK